MNSSDISKELSHLPIGPWKYFDQVGSTNDLAYEWVMKDAPDWSVVIADEQLSGRGRFTRRWITYPGAALAFSVILHPQMLIQVTHLSALGAIAVCQALEMEFSLQSEIKWPNDVLVNQQKLAGVLAEATWSGEVISAIILGIGVNVTNQSVPEPGGLSFPATCIEKELGNSVNRWKFMKKILERLVFWYSLVGSQEFLDTWWHYLAWKNREVVILTENGQPKFHGRLKGLEVDGALKLLDKNGKTQVIHAGDVHLRPG
jgi:BirA family transcriptional regulator, biotin operon repressor / biotin---[acetyl-CoA-carboxylase] ligase